MAAAPRPFFRSLLLGTLFVAAACSPTAPAAPTAGPTATPPPVASAILPTPVPTPAFPVTLRDDEGSEVVLAARPQHIVSLTPATTETLYALGVGDRVVAKVEDVADYPPEAAGIPVVATFAGVDIERIVALEADLVIAGGAGLGQGDAVDQLRRAGIPTLVLYPATIDDGLAGIKLLGLAVGEREAGLALADRIAAQLDDLATIASTAPTKPRVFYEIDVTNGIFTPPADSIYGEMLGLAGATVIPGDVSYTISLEDLVAADPEVILLGDAAYGQTAETVAGRTGWSGMTAVRTGRIEPIDDIVVTRPGPRIVDGLYALIRAIHPELDLDVLLPSFHPMSLPAAA